MRFGNENRLGELPVGKTHQISAGPVGGIEPPMNRWQTNGPLVRQGCTNSFCKFVHLRYVILPTLVNGFENLCRSVGRIQALGKFGALVIKNKFHWEARSAVSCSLIIVSNDAITLGLAQRIRPI